MELYDKEAIANLIRELDVPVVEFARRLGVHRTTVYHWLTGHASPQTDQHLAMNKLARDFRKSTVRAG